MFPVTILLLGMFFSLRGNRAQTVVQPDAHLTVSEGASLELKCSYSYGATPYLFWYVQYPGQSLQLLLRHFGGDTLVKGIKGFEAEFMKSNSSFNLRKNPAHWSDSAKYFCALSDTVPEDAGGAEHKPPRTFCDLKAHHKRFRERSLVMKMIKMKEQGYEECLPPKKKQI